MMILRGPGHGVGGGLHGPGAVPGHTSNHTPMSATWLLSV